MLGDVMPVMASIPLRPLPGRQCIVYTVMLANILIPYTIIIYVCHNYHKY